MNFSLKSNSYSKGVIVGALVGGAVSGIAALLFAPKKGSELRHDIATKSGDLYKDAYGKASTFAKEKTSQLASLIKDGKHVTEELAHEGTAKEHTSSKSHNHNKNL